MVDGVGPEQVRVMEGRLVARDDLEPSFKTAFHLASTEARLALERRDWHAAMDIEPELTALTAANPTGTVLAGHALSTLVNAGAALGVVVGIHLFAPRKSSDEGNPQAVAAPRREGQDVASRPRPRGRGTTART